MKKTNLLKFIDLYYLGKLIDSVVWTIKDDQVIVKLMTEDKSAVGTVVLHESIMPATECGIVDTTALLNMIRPLEEDITLIRDNNLLKLDSKGTYEINMEYPLADTSVIQRPGSIKTLPEFEVSIALNKELIDKMIAIKNSVETKSITFMHENDVLNYVAGYVGKISTNRAKMALVDSTSTTDLSPISFSAELFKNVLIANKDFTTGVIEISSKGLLHIKFEHDGLTSEYYIVKLND